jgi:hypothetical protein
MRDAGCCWMRDAGCVMLDAGYLKKISESIFQGAYLYENRQFILQAVQN